MIEIREYRPEDQSALAALHKRSGFDYRMPDLRNPLFHIKQVGTHDGQIVIGAAVKVEASAYLWMDGEWGTPGERWQALKKFNDDLRQEAASAGFDSVMAAIPPEIARRFEKRLKALGWTQDRPWPHYSLQL